MKVHALYGFDFPAVTLVGASTTSGQTTRVANGPWMGTVSNTECTLRCQTNSGWFTATLTAGAYNYGNYRLKVSASIKEMVAAITPTSSLWFGVQISFATGFTGAVLAFVASDMDITDSLSLLQRSDVTGFALPFVGRLEFNLNFATNTIQRRLNGLPLPSITMPAWMATAVSTTPGTKGLFVGIGATTSYSIQQGQSHNFSFRDFFCVEWEAGETQQFLGPWTVDKLVVDAATAPTWTPSTGTPTSVLKTQYNGGSLTTPTVTSDDAMTPASISYLASAIPNNVKIAGVLIKGRAAVSAATTGNLGISATVGSTESADVVTPMVAAQTFYDRLWSSDKSPTGLVWNQPSLAALVIKAKPKV